MVRMARASGARPLLGAIPPNFRPFAPEAQDILATVNAQLPALALQEGIPCQIERAHAASPNATSDLVAADGRTRLTHRRD